MLFMNRYDVADAVRQYGQRADAVGEATRALHALMVATDGNSDGWPTYSKPAKAGAGLMRLIQRERDRERWQYERRGGETEPAEVTQTDLRAALKPVKAFRTRSDWTFDLTDAERAATAATAARKADAEREAKVAALASRFEAELTEALSRDDMSAADIARMLADMATPLTSQEWARRRQERQAGANAALTATWS